MFLSLCFLLELCILIDTDMLETVLSIMYYHFTICKDRHGENILVGLFSWTYSHRHYVAAIFMVICEGQVRPQRGFSFVLVFQKKLYSLCNVNRQPSWILAASSARPSPDQLGATNMAFTLLFCQIDFLHMALFFQRIGKDCRNWRLMKDWKMFSGNLQTKHRVPKQY